MNEWMIYEAPCLNNMNNMGPENNMGPGPMNNMGHRGPMLFMGPPGVLSEYS